MKGCVLVSFFLLFFLSVPRVKAQNSVGVILPGCSTRSISGMWDNTTYSNQPTAVFRSVRYAPQPERWQAPTEVECPATFTTEMATDFGNICWQFNAQNFDVHPPRPQNEDCLFLDVYTHHPNEQNSKKPVVVWIHGGSLVFGSSTFYPHLDDMMKKLDVVLVSIQYRLGALGYLATEDLSNVDPRGSSGNYGLLDMIAALQWVKKNIVAFGGDADHVTVMGQSSGGTAIFHLMMTPIVQEQNLLQAAISLSGSPNISMSLNQAEAMNSVALADSVCGETNDQLSCLYNLSAQEVASILPSSYNVLPTLPVSYSEGQQYSGLAIVDGVTVPFPIEVAFSKQIVDVPFLMQSMIAEMDTFEGNETIYAMSSEEYTAFLEQGMEAGGWPPGSGDLVSGLYKKQLLESTELGYQQYLADTAFYCPNLELMTFLQNWTSPVYLSLIQRGPSKPLHTIPFTPPSLYAGHMWDYISGFNAWDYFFLVAEQPRIYHPDANDQIQSNLFFEQWQEMILDGKISSFISNSQSNSEEKKQIIQNYYPNLAKKIDGVVVTMLQTQSANGTPVVVATGNYERERCTTLRDVLALDQRFWCVN